MISGGNSPTHSQLPMGTRDVEKMKKAVLELVETERAYVKVSDEREEKVKESDTWRREKRKDGDTENI